MTTGWRVPLQKPSYSPAETCPSICQTLEEARSHLAQSRGLRCFTPEVKPRGHFASPFGPVSAATAPYPRGQTPPSDCIATAAFPVDPAGLGCRDSVALVAEATPAAPSPVCVGVPGRTGLLPLLDAEKPNGQTPAAPDWLPGPAFNACSFALGATESPATCPCNSPALFWISLRPLCDQLNSRKQHINDTLFN